MNKTYTTSALIIAFLTLSTCLFAQNKEEFEKIFLKETEGNGSEIKHEQFKNITNLSYYPDTLPNWFFTPPLSTQNKTYAVGISDPDLPIEYAVSQATFRAKTMAILYNRVQIQYFRDVYSLEFTEGKYTRYGQRFDTYFKLSSSGFADSTCFTIENQHITRYNEAVVLLSYTPIEPSKANMNNDLISTVGTALYIEAQIEDAFEPQAEYEFTSIIRSPNSTPLSATFTYREKGNRFLSISEYQGQAHRFPLFTYRYANPNWNSNTKPLISYNGLWSYFSKKFLRQLALETEQSSVKIRTLDEGYSTQMRNLSREVAIKNAKLQINGIEFGNDSIGFNINIIDL